MERSHRKITCTYHVLKLSIIGSALLRTLNRSKCTALSIIISLLSGMKMQLVVCTCCTFCTTPPLLFFLDW